jgi:hypothetical protein
MPDIDIRIERPNRTGRPDVHIIGMSEESESAIARLYYSYAGISHGFKRWIEPDMIRCIVCSILSDAKFDPSGLTEPTLVEVKVTEFGASGIKRVGTIYHRDKGEHGVAVRSAGTDHRYDFMNIGYGDVKCFLCDVFTTGRVPELGNGFGTCPNRCRPSCQGLPFLRK